MSHFSDEQMLYEPINTLKDIGPGIAIVDGPVVRMAYLGGSIPFPTRMTVVRLADGGLWVHSPTALTPALQAEIEARGPVNHLVSPNKIHYAHIAEWKAAFPNAVAWASPGVRERAKDQHIEVSFDADLHDAPEPAWAAEIDQLWFRGSAWLDEIVFFHRPSRTLILADLIESFEGDKMPPGMRWLVRLAGSAHPGGQAPLDLRMTFLGRKDQARASYEHMLAWGPERVVIAHGRWIERDGTAELRRSFRWLD